MRLRESKSRCLWGGTTLEVLHRDAQLFGIENSHTVPRQRTLSRWQVERRFIDWSQHCRTLTTLRPSPSRVMWQYTRFNTGTWYRLDKTGFLTRENTLSCVWSISHMSNSFMFCLYHEWIFFISEPESERNPHLGEPSERLALHILNSQQFHGSRLTQEHVETRSLKNPLEPNMNQVGGFLR